MSKSDAAEWALVQFPRLAAEMVTAFVEEMGGQLKQISSVAIATVGSRVLGLVRDVLIFAVLGVGPVNSAFVLAFTLPNLFRRLLGEGALTSAVIPVLSGNLAKEGRESGFGILNRVLSRLALVLLAIAVPGCGLLLLVKQVPGLAPRWYLGAELAALLLPYVIFICLAAMLSAGLHVLGRFFAPAIGPVLLNLAMITSLGMAVWWVDGADPAACVWWLCGGVMVGGFFQLALPWLVLRGEGWRFRPDLRSTVDTREISRLLLPAVAGAAVFQVNIVVSRLLAYSLNEEAAGILYLANRLVELPLGIFAASVTTVFFPLMARQVAAADGSGFLRTYERGLRLISVITLPAAAGLLVLAGPILRSLFEWGLFGAGDVVRTIGPLAVFSLGLPLYGWSSLATRGLHSWKEMQTPVRVGIVNAGLNLVLSLLLMGPLGEVGLALANVIAGLVFSVLLERALRRRLGEGPFSRSLVWGIGRMLLATVVMGLAVAGLAAALEAVVAASKLRALLTVALGIPFGVACYAGMLKVLRVPEVTEGWRLLVRRKGGG